MPDADKTVRILMQFLADKQGLGDAATGLDKVAAGADKVTQKQKQAGDESKNSAGKVKTLSETMEQLGSVGLKLGAMGTAITGPLIAAAHAYLQAVNSTTSTGRAWTAASMELEKSWQTIGASVAGVLLPALKQAAALSKDIAEYLDKHKGATTAALGVGGALTVAGGGLVVANQAFNVIKTLQKLGMWGTAAEGAATGGGILGGLTKMAPMLTKALPLFGSVLAAAGSAVGGVIAGSAGYDALNKAGVFGKDKESSSQIWKELGVIIAKGVGDAIAPIIGDKNAGNKLAVGMIQATGATTLPSSPGAQAADSKANASAVLKDYGMMYLQYVQQETEAKRQYNLTISRETRDFNLQLRYADEDYNKSRVRSQRDYNIQLAQSDMEFYRNRAIAARNFNIQMSRMDEDYQRSKARAEQDQQFNLFQIALTGDAMSYWLAQRQFKISQGRAAEDYSIQKSRATQDFQLQQADDAANYQIQRAFRQKQFDIQMQDAEQDYKIQRARQIEQFNIRLGDQAEDYRMQEQQRQIAFNMQLLNMQGDLQKVDVLWRTLTTGMISDLQTKIDQVGQGNPGQLIPTSGVQAGGGYIPSSGAYLMHSGEWTATRDTTKALEKMTGGPLTQGAVLTASSRGGSSRSLEYHDNRVFNAKISAEDRQSIKQDTTDLLRELFL